MKSILEEKDAFMRVTDKLPIRNGEYIVKYDGIVGLCSFLSRRFIFQVDEWCELPDIRDWK